MPPQLLNSAHLRTWHDMDVIKNYCMCLLERQPDMILGLLGATAEVARSTAPKCTGQKLKAARIPRVPGPLT